MVEDSGVDAKAVFGIESWREHVDMPKPVDISRRQEEKVIIGMNGSLAEKRQPKVFVAMKVDVQEL